MRNPWVILSLPLPPRLNLRLKTSQRLRQRQRTKRSRCDSSVRQRGVSCKTGTPRCAQNRRGVRVVTFLRPDDPPEEDLPQTFIDAYAEWAHSLTDAPIQYHKATGAIILSTIMAPNICLPTSFGVFIPNIWVMIL